MADAKPTRGFGTVDLEIGADERAPIADGFGAIDEPVVPTEPEAPPRSAARPSIHDDATRIVKGDALAELTREAAGPPPSTPHETPTQPPPSARSVQLAAAVAARPTQADAPPSSRRSSQLAAAAAALPMPSASSPPPSRRSSQLAAAAAALPMPSASSPPPSRRSAELAAAAALPMPPAHSGQATRMASLDEDLLAAARPDPPSIPSSQSAPSNSVPSRSGVSSRDEVALMRELYARGDAAGALSVAESIRSSVPDISVKEDSPDASVEISLGPEIEVDVSLSGLEPDALPPPSSREITPVPVSAPPAAGLTLTQRQSVPRVVKTPAEIAKLPIDHRGGFLLASIDGMQTLEEILDVCAMPGPEALDLVVTLVNLGVIEFD
jgi:hypothetical protein